LVTLIRKNNAAFPPEEIQSFVYDMLKGLTELDKLSIMHRDIKPENVMVRSKLNCNELVIVDFGLASRTDIPKYLLERCGTPGYVAPEVANFKSGEKLTPRCDIFSLGVLFHILMCRTHLFNGKNCDEVYMKNKKLDFDLSHPKYQAIDQKAMTLMRRMLEADPKKRISAS
jgi:serine/threonine protein kinase